MKLFFVLFFFVIINSQYFSFDDPPKFGPSINKGEVENDDIDEASGIASSYKNIGILWTHNDSGGENRIFALDTNGLSRGVYYINGTSNRDWEDLVVGPGPVNDESYIYIGDIGDNDAVYSIKYIYRVLEPEVSADSDNSVKIIQDASVISFTYPDKERDAETLMIDPLTKDLYIVGKRNTKVRIYKLPYPQATTGILQAEIAAEISLPNDPEENTPHNYITSGGISSNGNEIILKSYSNIYYWAKTDQFSIAQVMGTEPAILAYVKEPQGEAICWKNYDDDGYFTLSEEKVTFNDITFTFPAQLYYYPREIDVTHVKDDLIAKLFKLEQNYPNPFNPTTTIKYFLNKDADVKLKIYDNLGEEVMTLVNNFQPSGEHIIKVNSNDLASGIYYYSLKIGSSVLTKKMVLLK